MSRKWHTQQCGENSTLSKTVLVSPTPQKSANNNTKIPEMDPLIHSQDERIAQIKKAEASELMQSFIADEDDDDVVVPEKKQKTEQ